MPPTLHRTSASGTAGNRVEGQSGAKRRHETRSPAGRAPGVEPSLSGQFQQQLVQLLAEPRRIFQLVTFRQTGLIEQQ